MPGLKYGADYLAYTVDPCEGHAKYLVKLLQNSSRLGVTELAACERVANQAKKDLLVVYGGSKQ